MSGAFRLDPDQNYRSEIFDRFPWLAHGFGTRRACSVPLPLATVKQVHSAEIIQAGGAGGVIGEADALLSDAPGLAVGVRTADCVPILVLDPVRRVVGAIHAGWRGTVEQIARLTVERMRKIYQTDPADIYAAIGPAIGVCCFEVGPEVARRFEPWYPELGGTEGKEFIDLISTNATQLEAAGIPAEHVVRAERCTMCDEADFFSFRRNRGETGRMMSWVGIKTDGQ